MPTKGERGKATDFSIAAIMAPRGPSFGHYHLQGLGNASSNSVECSSKGFIASPSLDRTAGSPVNIVATATVVTDSSLLDDDEDDEVDEPGDESEGTEKSNNDDEEIDVDVEETSSLDDGQVGSDDIISHRKFGPTKDKRKLAQHRTTCNSDELRNVECHLETKELWDKFNELGTEMIITKTGRTRRVWGYMYTSICARE